MLILGDKSARNVTWNRILRMFCYLRPKTPAPIMRIASNGSGPVVMEGEGVAMPRIKEAMDEGRGEEWQ